MCHCGHDEKHHKAKGKKCWKACQFCHCERYNPKK